jgi:hypothetical protein
MALCFPSTGEEKDGFIYLLFLFPVCCELYDYFTLSCWCLGCPLAVVKIAYLTLSFQSLWISSTVLPIFYFQLCGGEGDAAVG